MNSMADALRDILEKENVMTPPLPCQFADATGMNAILKARGNKYGTFAECALISQNIKSAMRHSPNWQKLPEDMKEALEMIATKLARILNGDPSYIDSWSDLSGYSQLVAGRLGGEIGHSASHTHAQREL